MSVVNKMLKDLEARQSRAERINADYHPPQKKRSKLLLFLVLLVLSIAAIIFVFIDDNQMFYEDNNTSVSASENSQPSRSLTPTKMMAIAGKSQTQEQEQIQPQVTSSQFSNANMELVITETAPPPPLDVLNNKQILRNEDPVTTATPSSLQNIETQYKQLNPQKSDNLNTQTSSEQTPSFSMIDSSQKDDISSLKQHIVESLNNGSFDLAQSQLNKVLVIEPNNIKARKKLASLLFAQGSYSQSEQVLIQGIELNPAQNDLRLMLARLYTVQKESFKALNILVGFQPRSGNKTEYLAYRASLAQQFKQTELAKSDYQILTNIEPDNAQWWLGLAIIRDQLGEITMALQAYNKANTLGQLDHSVNDFIQQRISVLAGAQ